MPRQFAVVKLMGRCGNQFYQIATAIAYAQKHNLDWFATSTAENCDDNAYYFKFVPQRDLAGTIYNEKVNENGYSYYAEIPCIPNTMLIGYWQSFKYFEEYRDTILETFNLPYNKNEFVSIHIRRGDYLVFKDKFPPLPLSYYQNAVEYMNRMGYYRFIVFSDDIEWCKTMFHEKNFPVKNGMGLPITFHDSFLSMGELVNDFHFSEGRNELEDLAHMANCQHNIVANSTFSYAASWFNRNPNKIVLTPTIKNMFEGCNIDMIPEKYVQIPV